MIYVKDIINLCNGKLLCGDINFECINFCKDTREINKGDIYVGIKGETFNGNNFYKDAFKNGASLCILDYDTIIDNEYINDNYAIILVNDTVDCLQKLASYKRDLYDIPVVAVTGSVGKTSVKDIISSVLSSKYNVLSTKGNLNNHIGLPLTMLNLNDSHQVLVVEMGMNHFDEIHVLSMIARPTISIITNIGTAHIGILGSRENILKAKLEILDGMDGGYLIVNNDNDLLRTVKYDNLVTVGVDNNSDFMANNIFEDVFSSSFYINDMHVSLPVGSKAFIYNALFAFAVGTKLGMSLDEISDSLKEFKLSPHRLELIKTDKINIIDDTYNASYDSVKNSLELLSKVNGRKVFIFADILELDEFGKEIHTDIGKLVIENNIDVFITVGDLAKYSYNVVKSANKECYYFENNDELLKVISNILSEKDTVLLKGSNGMRLIDVSEYLRNNMK